MSLTMSVAGTSGAGLRTRASMFSLNGGNAATNGNGNGNSNGVGANANNKPVWR
jgi:hypothetical protein